MNDIYAYLKARSDGSSARPDQTTSQKRPQTHEEWRVIASADERDPVGCHADEAY